MRDRVKADPHPVLIRHLFAGALRDRRPHPSFHHHMRVNAAHVVLLSSECRT